MEVVVTGAGGLVGATAADYYCRAGAGVVAIENGTRQRLLGKDGNTWENLELLRRRHRQLRIERLDVRSAKAAKLAAQAELVIHCAAQVSHPRSIEIPQEDADININGTLNLLEAMRRAGRTNVPFIFCSTNKVYGDAPNELPYEEGETRYTLPRHPHGIDETLRVDRTLHTPFGCSKLAADIYAQEYGRLYGLQTGVFRMSCITGPFSRATVHQNWIAYFLLCNLTGRPLTIYGWKGKQVRDNIDARDLVEAFDHFARRPRPGEVYNMGGERDNAVSCLEVLERSMQLTGQRTGWSPGPTREGDHRVYITDMGKFRGHYPQWNKRIGLDQIVDDLLGWVKSTLNSAAA